MRDADKDKIHLVGDEIKRLLENNQLVGFVIILSQEGGLRKLILPEWSLLKYCKDKDKEGSIEFHITKRTSFEDFKVTMETVRFMHMQSSELSHLCNEILTTMEKTAKEAERKK